MTNKQCIAIVYRVLFIAICTYGLLLVTGLLGKGFNPAMVNYYTIWANGLSLLYFIVLILMVFVSGKRRSENEKANWFTHFKGAVVLALTLTLLVYNFVLLPNLSTMPNYVPFTITDILIHYVVPLMVIFDWLLFDKKGVYTVYDPLKWLIFPLIYLFFTIIKASFGYVIPGLDSKYPYFFIDIDLLGATIVTIIVFVLILVFLGFGYLLWFIDKQTWWKK